MKLIFLFAVVVIGFLFYFVESTIKEYNFSNLTISNQAKQILSPTPTERRKGLWFENSEISPNRQYIVSSYNTGNYDDKYYYYQIFITELNTDKMYRIYSGDFRTMDWKWTKDNKIKILYDCGTGCLSTRIIDLNEHVSLGSDRSDKWITETFKSY